MAIKTSTHLYDVIDTNVNKKVADTTTVKKSTGSKVTWSQLQAPGTHIANITINGTQTQIYAPDPGSTVTWSQVLGSGTKIASININGTATDVYAPSTTGAPAWGTITGTLSDQTDLQSALNGKAASSHNHSISQVTNLQTTLDGKAASVHTHAIGDTTGLTAALEGKAPTSHTHTISQVSSLQNVLNGKAATSHTHTASQVTDLTSLLDQKANVNHSHVSDNVSYTREGVTYTLTGALDNLNTGKAETYHTHYSSTIGYGTDSNVGEALDELYETKADTGHNHAIADVTNLQTTLNGKASTSHTHTIANVTNLQTTLNNKANAAHSHNQSDVNGLVNALNLKASLEYVNNQIASVVSYNGMSHTGAIVGALTIRGVENQIRLPTNLKWDINQVVKVVGTTETPLETLLDNKADFYHEHYSSTIGYGEDSNVGEALDELFDTKVDYGTYNTGIGKRQYKLNEGWSLAATIDASSINTSIYFPTTTTASKNEIAIVGYATLPAGASAHLYFKFNGISTWKAVALSALVAEDTKSFIYRFETAPWGLECTQHLKYNTTSQVRNVADIISWLSLTDQFDVSKIEAIRFADSMSSPTTLSPTACSIRVYFR